MEQQLLSAGWQKIDANQYIHTDGRSLYRQNGRWYVQELRPKGPRARPVGRTLKEAIERVLEVKENA